MVKDGTNWGGMLESADSVRSDSLTSISWERHDGFNTVILIHRCGGAHVIACLVVMHSNNITCITAYGMFWYSNRSTKVDLDLDIIPQKGTRSRLYTLGVFESRQLALQNVTHLQAESSLTLAEIWATRNPSCSFLLFFWWVIMVLACK